MKYNYNLDKGTEEVFGFTEGDESWEILQNGTERVGFRSADYSDDGWKNDFEARYPEDNVDISNLKAFAEFLVSTDSNAATDAALDSTVTYDGIAYTTDSAEYRLAKFRAELADHANVDAMVYYYVITELFLCIDQREKNAFPTLWKDDPNQWMMLFYDADSSLGIDNKGNLAFDYYLEDIDYTEAGDPVFNGQASVLWVNLRKCFYSEIEAEYKRLRTTIRSDGSGRPLLSYDVVNDLFESHQGKWSEAIYNEDGYRKSIEAYVLNGDTLYLPMLQGKKEQQRKWWLYNRFRYLDSKYNIGSSMEKRINIRAHAKANVSLKSYVNMYGHVYYNNEMVEHRMYRNSEDPYVFEWTASGAEDPVIGINDADMLTSLGDLSPLMVELINISEATHLTELKVGDASPDYVNNNLNSVTLGNNVLLKSIDFRNCVTLTQAVDASGCTGLEEAYFDGTAITSLTVPNGGNLKILHLPGTITSLTLRNQYKLTDFVLPNYSNITTLWLENVSSAVDPLAILNAIPEKSRVRLLGVNFPECTAEEAMVLCDRLDTMRGITESGDPIDTAQVSGTIYIPSLTGEELYRFQSRYPNITVIYNNITLYTVRFFNGNTLLQTVENVMYGANIAYDGDTPLKEGEIDESNWKFIGWSPDSSAVTGNMDCYAQFEFKGSYARSLVTRSLTGTYTNERVNKISKYVFMRNSSLVSVNMPNVTEIGENAFGTCTSLVTINAPLTQKLDTNTFASCSSLKHIDVSNVTQLGSSTFQGCISLEELTFPSFTGNVWNLAFYNCTALRKVDFAEAHFVRSRAFDGCTSLEAVIIRKNGVCTLSNTDNFKPFTQSTIGYIYVPSAVVEAYKVATNWSTFADRIRAIEDYPDICGGED